MDSLQSLILLERCAKPSVQRMIIKSDPARIEEVSRLLDIIPLDMISDPEVLYTIDAYALKEDVQEHIHNMDYKMLMRLLRFLIESEKDRKFTRNRSSSDIACDLIDSIEDEIIKR